MPEVLQKCDTDNFHLFYGDSWQDNASQLKCLGGDGKLKQYAANFFQ